MIQKSCLGEGGGERRRKKNAYLFNKLIDVMVSNVFFGCEILHDCEIQ
jgi:hypothetical protein